MHIDIISGFLGSGKTTFIHHLIREKYQQKKIVIIENEFGEIGIDSHIMKEEKAIINELTSGCICCSIQKDFTKAIKLMKEKYQPDVIMIEPSGVANLSDVLKQIQTVTYDTLHIYTMIDVSKFELYRLNFKGFYENQLANSKHIIFTHCDEVEEFKINEVQEKILTDYPYLSIGLVLQDEVNHEIKITPTEKFLLPFCTYSFKNIHSLTKKQLEKLSSILQDNTIIRAKGILKIEMSPKLLQYIPDRLEITEYLEYEEDGKLCIIATDTNLQNKIQEVIDSYEKM